LGGAVGAAAAFPSGYAGDAGFRLEFSIESEFPALMVRPVGVTLVAHLEHWREVRGRELAASGAPVLDIEQADLQKPYTPLALTVPPTRAQTFPPPYGSPKGNGAAPKGAPAVTPFHLQHPHSLPFQPVRVVTGQRGIGKSGLLNYALHYATLNSWLTVFVPSGFAMAWQGKVMVPSRLRPGMYDQNDWALDILKRVASTNGPLLARVPQRGTYASYRYLPPELDIVVSKEREELYEEESEEVATLKAKLDAEGKLWDESLFSSKFEDESDTSRDRSGFTLADMVSWGLKHPPAATDTVLALLDELRACTEFPVLVAVDGINHCYEQGPHAMGGLDVPPQNLSLQSALHCLGPHGFREDTHSMARGVWLLAVTHGHTENMDPFFQAARVLHKYRIPVPTMGRQEIYAQLARYHKSGKLFMLEGAFYL